jgi:hypothetical protein
MIKRISMNDIAAELICSRTDKFYLPGLEVVYMKGEGFVCASAERMMKEIRKRFGSGKITLKSDDTIEWLF